MKQISKQEISIFFGVGSDDFLTDSEATGKVAEKIEANNFKIFGGAKHVLHEEREPILQSYLDHINQFISFILL